MGNAKSKSKSKKGLTKPSDIEKPVQDFSHRTLLPHENGDVPVVPKDVNTIVQQETQSDVDDRCSCSDCVNEDDISPLDGEWYYSFDSRHGKNVKIMNGGKTARRKHAKDLMNYGVVVTEQSLQRNQRFEVRLDGTVDNWPSAGLELGIVNNPPDNLQCLPSMLDYKGGMTLLWSGSEMRVRTGESDETVLNFTDEFNCTEGDTIGVMLSEHNILHFYTNGNQVEETLDLREYGIQDTDKLHVVVDINSGASQVSICAAGFVAENPTLLDLHQREISEDDYKDPRVVMELMRLLMRSIKNTDELDIYQASELVRRFLVKAKTECRDQSIRQKYGNHLANLGAANQLRRLLGLLMTVADPGENDWNARNVVRSACWNYSDYSVKMCKCFGQCGLLCDMLSDLDKYHSTFADDKNHHSLVLSAMSVLHNCSKATDNYHIYHNLNATERILPYVKISDIKISTLATLTLSNIIKEDKQDLVEADEKVVTFLLETLEGAIDDNSMRYQGFTALEVVAGLGNIAVNNINKIRIIDKGATPLLVKLMLSDRPMEQECAIQTLTVLCKLEVNSTKISQTSDAVQALNKLTKHEKASVREAAERALAIIQPQKQNGLTKETIVSESVSHYSVKEGCCKYQELCKRLLKSLDLTGGHFDRTHDLCYCNSCHIAKGDELYYHRGKPPKLYGVPIGWCRFAIGVHGRASALNVFQNWHVAFHGTLLDSVKPILECGDLLMPGDVTMDGKRLGVREGHFTDDAKPKGFDTQQIFLSPSIRYSSLNVYAYPKTYEDKVTNQKYSARAAFQVRIKPDSYNVGPETVGATSQIDPKFSNQELEWFTKQRGSVIIYGLLLSLQPVTSSTT